jgi:hypothetical protein
VRPRATAILEWLEAERGHLRHITGRGWTYSASTPAGIIHTANARTVRQAVAAHRAATLPETEEVRLLARRAVLLAATESEPVTWEQTLALRQLVIDLAAELDRT